MRSSQNSSSTTLVNRGLGHSKYRHNGKLLALPQELRPRHQTLAIRQDVVLFRYLVALYRSDVLKQVLHKQRDLHHQLLPVLTHELLSALPGGEHEVEPEGLRPGGRGPPRKEAGFIPPSARRYAPEVGLFTQHSPPMSMVPPSKALCELLRTPLLSTSVNAA